MPAFATRDQKVPPCIPIVINYVSENFGEEISLQDLAEAAGVTRFTLCRSFERCFGTTVMNWLWQVRVKLANFFLETAVGGRLTDIAVLCGFNSSAHFSRTFRRHFLTSPSQILRRQQPKLWPTDALMHDSSLRTHAERIARGCLFRATNSIPSEWPK